MRRLAWQCIGVGMVLAGCGSSPPPPAHLSAPVVATPRAATDRIDVTTDNGVVILDVHSPSGIGAATLDFDSGSMTALRFRLHLKGLEELRLEYDSTAVRVAVASNAPYDAHCSVGERGEAEIPIAQGDPRFMTARLRPAADGPPKIPLQDGVIEVDGPLELLRGGVRTATVHWVDFFR